MLKQSFGLHILPLNKTIMKKIRFIIYFFFVLVTLSCENSSAQNPENWTSKDLTAPSDLAATLKSNKNVPIMFSIGPGAIIPNSIDIGMVKDKKNMDKFRAQISKLPKTANILIYCGCCPYEHCPDVRPAIALLKNMKFTNYHLLDLPQNIKTDWIAKGYPTKE